MRWQLINLKQHPLLLLEVVQMKVMGSFYFYSSNLGGSWAVICTFELVNKLNLFIKGFMTTEQISFQKRSTKLMLVVGW